MTKAEFVIAYKEALPDLFVSKVAAERAFDVFCEILAQAALTEKGVRLSGVGTICVASRSARTGRNPRTGDVVRIPARKSIKFITAARLAAKAHVLK